jgi:hypothetical protein
MLSGAASAVPDSILFYVESDFFHTYLIVPSFDPRVPCAWRRYEYADVSYYLKNDHSPVNTFRVLFRPTPATVGEYCYPGLPGPDFEGSERFTFRLPAENFRRMESFIESWINRKDTLESNDFHCFFTSTQPYTWRNNCHHFVLKTLQAGGIPVDPGQGVADYWARRELRKYCIADKRHKGLSPVP